MEKERRQSIARAGGADYNDELAPLNGEAHAIDGTNLNVTHMVRLAHVPELNKGHRSLR